MEITSPITAITITVTKAVITPLQSSRSSQSSQSSPELASIETIQLSSYYSNQLATLNVGK